MKVRRVITKSFQVFIKIKAHGLKGCLSNCISKAVDFKRSQHKSAKKYDAGRNLEINTDACFYKRSISLPFMRNMIIISGCCVV